MELTNSKKWPAFPCKKREQSGISVLVSEHLREFPIGCRQTPKLHFKWGVLCAQQTVFSKRCFSDCFSWLATEEKKPSERQRMLENTSVSKHFGAFWPCRSWPPSEHTTLLGKKGPALHLAIRLRFRCRFELCDANDPQNVKSIKQTLRNTWPSFFCSLWSGIGLESA